jgi:hypothetical protein
MHAVISLQVTSLHTGKKLQIRYVYAGPELTGLRHSGILLAKGNTMAHAKTSSLKQTTWQLWPAKVRRWCGENTMRSGSACRRLLPLAVVLAIPTQAAVLAHHLQPFSDHCIMKYESYSKYL